MFELSEGGLSENGLDENVIYSIDDFYQSQQISIDAKCSYHKKSKNSV